MSTIIMSLFVLQTKYLSNWWHQSFLKINLHRTARFDLNETDKQTFKKHSGGSRSHYFSEKRAYCSKLLKTHSFTHSVAEPEPVWAGLLLSGTGAGFWRRLRLKKLKNTWNLAKLFSFSTFDWFRRTKLPFTSTKAFYENYTNKDKYFKCQIYKHEEPESVQAGADGKGTSSARLLTHM